MERAADHALRVALEVAATAGIRPRRPVVLHEGSSLLVHLAPAPVVARVALVTATVRPGDAWYAREIAVAAHMQRAGAPAVAPSAELPPGPHVRSGMTLSFWEYARPSGDPVDAEAAGRALRECHEALRDFAGDLPVHGLLHESEAIAQDREAARAVRDARARVEALGLPLQPVHGDADLDNAIETKAGPLWNDWEDTQLAPAVWDLGCLHAGARLWDEDPAEIAAAQRGYGPMPDEEILAAFVEARRAQVEAWRPLFE